MCFQSLQNGQVDPTRHRHERSELFGVARYGHGPEGLLGESHLILVQGRRFQESSATGLIWAPHETEAV